MISFMVQPQQAKSQRESDIALPRVLIISNLPATLSESEHEHESNVKRHRFSIGSCSHLSEK